MALTHQKVSKKCLVSRESNGNALRGFEKKNIKSERNFNCNSAQYKK